MDSSVSPKDEIWSLCVCHHVSNPVYHQLPYWSLYGTLFRGSETQVLFWFWRLRIWSIASLVGARTALIMKLNTTFHPPWNIKLIRICLRKSEYLNTSASNSRHSLEVTIDIAVTSVRLFTESWVNDHIVYVRSSLFYFSIILFHLVVYCKAGWLMLKQATDSSKSRRRTFKNSEKPEKNRVKETHPPSDDGVRLYIRFCLVSSANLSESFSCYSAGRAYSNNTQSSSVEQCGHIIPCLRPYPRPATVQSMQASSHKTSDCRIYVQRTLDPPVVGWEILVIKHRQ
jgi:hypothetical protein